MRILQINSVYKKGSTGKIVSELHTFFQNAGHESYVLYGRKKQPKEKNVFKVSSEIEAKLHAILALLFGLDFAFSPIATLRTIKLIKKIKPDIVHIHCLNGHYINAYKLLRFLKKNRIKTVLTLHAEIMHTAGCEHAMECDKWLKGCYGCTIIKGLISSLFVDDSKKCYKLMKTSFDGFYNLAVVGCSKWVMNRAMQSSMFSNCSCSFFYVHNNIDYSVFKFIPATNLRARLGINSKKKIILNVTSNFKHPIKGPSYLIEIAKKLPDYQFIIVGFNGWKDTLPKNILTINHTSNQFELAEFYSIADCFISTSIRETLPTVCLEATACCCPVLAFNSGGSIETIDIGQGDVVKPYNVDEFVEKIKLWSNKPKIIKDHSYKKMMGDNYIGIYEKLG